MMHRRDEASGEAFDPGWQRGGGASAEHPALGLDGDGRLPWLESGDDEEDYHGAVDAKRVISVAVAALLLLAGMVGGVWWVTHRHLADAPQPDGSVIPAPDGPYKQPPQDPGGKTYAGTGDTSFVVSQGQNPPEHLADNNSKPIQPIQGATPPPITPPSITPPSHDAPAHDTPPPPHATRHTDSPTPANPGTGASAGTNASASANASTGTGATEWHGGIAQIGAFYSQARAETAWTQIAHAHDVLAGFKHRVVSGQVDSGTVYRLQVLTESGAAGSLCNKLRGTDVACQVKH